MPPGGPHAFRRLVLTDAVRDVLAIREAVDLRGREIRARQNGEKVARIGRVPIDSDLPFEDVSDFFVFGLALAAPGAGRRPCSRSPSAT